MRLLRSHAGGVGDALPDELVRATLLIRLAQMAAGGGGHRPEIADALAAILRDGPLPVLRDLGGIGTGDLTLLAQLGLALAGEGEWRRSGRRSRGEPPRHDRGRRRARADELERRHARRRRARLGRRCASCSTPGSASRR